jgi:DNA-binding transcriptional ArsR family regulator
MKEGPDIAGLGALIGDPARANILGALMSGLALTAGELAGEAGITPQTASTHLAKLLDAGLLAMTVQGRHRYYRLAGPEVAGALESLMELASRTGRLRARPGPRDPAMRVARVCYDHLAGEMGVRLFDALLGRGLLVAGADGLALSPDGRAWLDGEGIDVAELERRHRPVCRVCLDWSERRSHLAGSVGAALLDLFLGRRWAVRDSRSRALLFTPAGMQGFAAFVEGNRTAARLVAAM